MRDAIIKKGALALIIFIFTMFGGLSASRPVQVSAAAVPNGTYKVVSALNGKYVMDVNGASSADFANVQLYEDNGTNAQKFRFTRQADGSYIICNVNSGKVLDCFGAGKTNGTNIQQYTSNGTAAQRWKVTSAGAGCYTITCKCNGLPQINSIY